MGGKPPDAKNGQTTFVEFSTPMSFLTTVAVAFVVYVAIPSLLAGLLFRGGLILRVFGVAVAKKDGMKASRLRILWRNIITWSPFMLMLILFAVLMTPLSGSLWTGVLAIGLIITLVVLIVWSALLPERSLQDRLAGTCLVPR